MARLWFPPERDCLDSYLFEGKLESWNSGILKKQLIKTSECIVPRKALFFKSPRSSIQRILFPIFQQSIIPIFLIKYAVQSSW
jgi:hypothetical protein